MEEKGSSKEQGSQTGEVLGDQEGTVPVSKETAGQADTERSPCSSKEAAGGSSLPGDGVPAETSPREELRTSDVYKIRNNIPKRFDHPGAVQCCGCYHVLHVRANHMNRPGKCLVSRSPSFRSRSVNWQR